MQGEATAPDAAIEAVAEPLEQGDLGLDAAAPGVGDPVPVLVRRGPAGGEGAERVADLVEAKAHLLGHADERHPPDGVAGKATVSGGRAGGVDQPLGFVVPQGGGRHAGPGAQGADGELGLQGGER